MKSNKFIQNTKGQLDINLAVLAVLGLVLVSSFLVIGTVVLQGIVDGTGIEASTQGTVVYTQSDISTHLENITIGSEIYTITNTTTAAFDVPVGTNMTATKLIEELVAEIGVSSVLVTAVDNGDDTTTITSILGGTVGNYASTNNVANGTFATATLTGGVDADSFYTTLTTLTTSIQSAMALAGTLLMVIIGTAILMLLAGVMVIMQLFRR
jgi:hypothetical protein